MVTVQFSGAKAAWLFSGEAGGHRWQRVPPTERGGRTHSSTVTVAVLSVAGNDKIELRDSDLQIRSFIGQGPGGQHKQKNATAVEITHLPTGVTAVAQSERSLRQNIEHAKSVLLERVREAETSRLAAERNGNRKQQIGSGMRSDKVRTVQEQNGKVVDHVTGGKTSLKNYLKGKLEALKA